MGEIVQISDNVASEKNDTDIASMTEGFLIEVRENPLPVDRMIKVPIADFSILGAGIAALEPVLQMAAQNAENAEKLYRVVNMKKNESLKIAKDGTFWGTFFTAEGKSKMAKFEVVNAKTVLSEANVAMLIIAVALSSIEKDLARIKGMGEEILSLLQIEKESEIEADVITLNNIISKYKFNWDNEHFVTSNHKLVCDIQRTARKNIISYQKKVTEIIGKKKLIIPQNRVDQTLRELLNRFQYYRLSLYIFSLASMTEIMLSENYKEENISNVQHEVRKYSDEYRDLFTECSVFLEKMARGAVETNALKGIGIASDTIGKAVGSIPKIKDGRVDEFLQEQGEKLQSSSEDFNKNVISSFSKVSDPNTCVFIEKMNEMIQIYDKTKEVCFDSRNIYLVS